MLVAGGTARGRGLALRMRKAVEGRGREQDRVGQLDAEQLRAQVP
jgi:hypothetical protein